eukprot:5278923-Pleurochrysis_carterae.AAC.1
MLTRFVTAVPAVTTSAEEAYTILMTHDFTKYSIPMVIKSDKGSAFRYETTSKFAEYAGLRRVFVLPYNAPAMQSRQWLVSHVCWFGIHNN